MVRENDDPRLAAALVLVAIARADGELSTAEAEAISAQLNDTMGLSVGEATELLGQAKFMASNVAEASRRIRRAVAPVQTHCSVSEQRQLLAMAEAIATVEGDVAPAVAGAIRTVRQALSL